MAELHGRGASLCLGVSKAVQQIGLQCVCLVVCCRDDCEVVNLPLDAVAYVTGSKGSNLRRVEEETGTFIFLDGARGGGEERLLIFCYDADARRRARMRIEERIDEKLSGRAR